jgi:hypothetical protein
MGAAYRTGMWIGAEGMPTRKKSSVSQQDHSSDVLVVVRPLLVDLEPNRLNVGLLKPSSNVYVTAPGTAVHVIGIGSKGWNCDRSDGDVMLGVPGVPGAVPVTVKAAGADGGPKVPQIVGVKQVWGKVGPEVCTRQK